MKKTVLMAAFLLTITGPALAAEVSSSNTVYQAIAKLQAAPNYSWTTTVKMPGSQFEPGPLKARTEKAGYTFMTQEMGDFTSETVFKGEKIAMKQEGEWRSREELDGFPAMMAGWVTRNGTAAQEATNMLARAKELKSEEGGIFAADYSDEGAKALLSFGGPGAPPKDAKGSIKFWLKDGALTKFESQLKGLVSWGQDGEERPFEMTRTFEIQDVGSTKVEVPDDARKKLEPKAVEEKKPEGGAK